MPLGKGAKTMTNLMSKKSFVDSNISINPQSLTDLTEGQKACLRLVVQHHTSKEIARKLGISRYTVDQRLDAARHKLNAASRKDAAKIFAERDTYQISQPFVYEAIVLEPAQFVANSREAPRRVTQGNTKLFSIFSVPPAGGERHELSSKEIVVHALNIAFFSTLVMAFVVVVLTGTFRLFQ